MFSNLQSNPQQNLTPPFTWNQLTPTQQTRLAHLLARLLKPHLRASQQQRKEVRLEPSSQNP